MNAQRRTQGLLFALLLFLIASRLCHSGILWADGNYHLAAAMQWHDGKALYRDLWYDKPPLTALLYLLCGRPTGWALSLFEATVAWVACICAYLTARRLGGVVAGWLAASLLAFFLIFYLPTAVIPVAPDLLMIAPHLAAVYFAIAARPAWSGVLAAVAFWINAKGVFVLLACLVIAPASWLPLLLGFAAPCVAGALLLIGTGAWHGYIEQVWRWSTLYARSTPLENPWSNALWRTGNWAGFHAALVAGTGIYFSKKQGGTWWKLLLWTAISAVAVAQGLRFLPRYYFQLLAPLCVLAALGWSSLPRRRWIAVALASLLLVPFFRFAPRYLTLAREDLFGRKHQWSDLALDQDNQDIAAVIARLAPPNATLLVWGYRPGLYVYTRLHSPSIFWDSQPLTGVPADRHLGNSISITPEWARQNRALLSKSHPTVIVDALARLNGTLAIERFADLQPWFTHYRLCGETALSRIYCVQ